MESVDDGKSLLRVSIGRRVEQIRPKHRTIDRLSVSPCSLHETIDRWLKENRSCELEKLYAQGTKIVVGGRRSEFGGREILLGRRRKVEERW